VEILFQVFGKFIFFPFSIVLITKHNKTKKTDFSVFFLWLLLLDSNQRPIG